MRGRGQKQGFLLPISVYFLVLKILSKSSNREKHKAGDDKTDLYLH